MGVSRSEDKRVALSERIRQRHSCVLQFEELLRQFFRYVDFLIATGRLQTELSNDLFFRVVLPAQGDDLGLGDGEEVEELAVQIAKKTHTSLTSVNP